MAADDEIVLAVQINGKRRGEVRVEPGAEASVAENLALADPSIRRHLEGLTVRKVIVVKDRIVNIVAG